MNKRVRSVEFHEKNNARSKEYYKANKEIIAEKAKIKNKKLMQKDPISLREMKRKVFIKSTYGITINDYNRMLEEQDFECKICGKKHQEEPAQHRLHIDHNHITGKVRGLLCKRCNTAIGAFDDNVPRLYNAIHYLLTTN